MLHGPEPAGALADESPDVQDIKVAQICQGIGSVLYELLRHLLGPVYPGTKFDHGVAYSVGSNDMGECK